MMKEALCTEDKYWKDLSDEEILKNCEEHKMEAFKTALGAYGVLCTNNIPYDFSFKMAERIYKVQEQAFKARKAALWEAGQFGEAGED